jgi:lyso-ornithine lipid O-acyltransferase
MIAAIRIAFALVAVGLTTAVLLPMHLVALNSKLVRPGRAPRLWHRVAVRLLGLRIKVRGVMSDERPLLIAANHISWADITVLGSVAEVSFVAKADMAAWPLFGTLARWQRSVFIERDRRRSSSDQVSAIAERMKEGDAIVLFAEGTTADGNRLLPFKSTLFGAAEFLRGEGLGGTVYVQPVSIAYTRLQGMPMGRQHRGHVAWVGNASLIPHLKAVLSEGALDVEVRFGEAIEFGPDVDRKVVARKAEAQVRAMMAEALRGSKSG